MPGATRIAAIADPANATHGDYAEQLNSAAKRIGLKLQMFPVTHVEQLESAFETMRRSNTEILIFGAGPYASQELGKRARAIGVPLIGQDNEATGVGAVLSYGWDVRYMWLRAAVFVDKLLRGVKPQDLPFEQPTRVELYVNLPAARAIHLSVPQSLLLRADRVIE